MKTTVQQVLDGANAALQASGRAQVLAPLHRNSRMWRERLLKWKMKKEKEEKWLKKRNRISYGPRLRQL
jgi:hypothetical protein